MILETVSPDMFIFTIMHINSISEHHHYLKMETLVIILFSFSFCQIPQVEMPFFVELYEVSAGAAINNSARFAQIKFVRRDGPQSLVYFSVGSRLPVAHKKATLISLQVARDSGTGLMMSVNFSTQVSMEYVLTHIKVFFFTCNMCHEKE